MRPIRSVSVLMPTWQGRAFLERVLASLAEQQCTLPWDFLAIDSGSSDGTWELLGQWQARFPVALRRERIEQLEFDHGDTRNRLVARSRGDLCVFLTQDALPVGPHWLTTLVANFDDPRVGAAYCRNVPRPDAQRLTKLFSAEDPGYQTERREVRLPPAAEYQRMSAHEKRLLWNFNDVASALRRELWELHPFPRTWFGEDVLMARALLEAGHTVVYDAAAAVEHSHDYAPEECRSRAKIDARFNAEWLGRTCVASAADARTLTERFRSGDRAALIAQGIAGPELERELALAEILRRATFEGLYEGGQTNSWRAATHMLERRELSILFVVHSFPPETWAGTEVYTLNLARALALRGHKLTILARADAKQGEAEGGPAEFSVREERFEGLRVLRLTHRLRHRRMSESWQQPDVEQAFARLLLAEAPDLVHFQHLIHLSTGLVHVAREFDLPCVLTCHDYWSLCARVQLIRPDGTRCEKNMGSGCFLCIKERGLDQIERVARLDQVAAPLLSALASGSRHGRVLSERTQKLWEGYADLRGRQATVLAAYAAADLRISPSRFLRSKLVESGAFEPHTFLYSDNGMRTDHVRALAKEPDAHGRVRFGFVGSLVWYKGGEVMLRAMRELDPARASLTVFGDFKPEGDAHHAELARWAGPNVRFAGRFDNARLSQVYAQIDVLLVPSIWYENSPITIHEAFLTRTPVVASGIGGMAEYVRDGVDGLHFKVGDAHDLAAKLQRFLDEPELVEQLSRSFPEVKTIEDDAADMEYRYRALVCARTGRGPQVHTARTLWERPALAADQREGAVEAQGADMLLLRPGRSAVEYDITGAGGGARTLRIEQLALAVEKQVLLGARVLVDGREVGFLPVREPARKDEVFAIELALELARGARTLRIEVLQDPKRPSVHARLKHLSISTRPLCEGALSA